MKIHFTAPPWPQQQEALNRYIARYGHTHRADEADVIVALGGDGHMLRALISNIYLNKPVYGLNFGHAGYLSNRNDALQDLVARVESAERITLSPLHVEATLTNNVMRRAFAINEIHICNHRRQELIYMRVDIDGEEVVSRLGADGLIISTTIGSTGYNKSARGPILPLGDDMIAFTPNNAFVPDRLRACVLRPAPISVDIMDPDFRRADVYADFLDVGKSACKVNIRLDTEHPYTLLFDRSNALHKKIMSSQFPKLTPA